MDYMGSQVTASMRRFTGFPWMGGRKYEENADLADLVAAVGRRESELEDLSDQSLRERAAQLRRRARSGEVLDGLLEESFALVREVSRRVLGLRPYDVQILAGLALHRGEVVEMQTGEGKTLAAVAPAFLNALTGRGVHILTFNDYLARRDAQWMGPVYEALGLRLGCVQEGMSVPERQAAYACDVTYATAKEAGFDLLRDRLCLEPEHQVHRPFHFALVDEADSILIDEARIPLVIAGDVDAPGTELSRLAEVARRLDPGRDYDTDETARNVFLTERGSHRVEEILGCGPLFAPENAVLLAEVRNALHAEVLLQRDVDYIVRGGEVELVDEFTGRVAENRRWPDGLQSAVEAKEGLLLRDEGKILGSVTLQHFLRLYPRLSGMTGTARPAAEELETFYGLEVRTVPTHRPCVRVDHPDQVFLRKKAKERALVDEIVRVHGTGRPILVGTVSVRESEQLAERLREAGVSCRVLNAKNDEEEAAIVAEAGAPGAVTISTNMAGRGTDIRLGGADEAAREKVVALGGLYVIGTNRHESRRIDDQLRGRAGRQGDPGSTRFILSLEDELLDQYGIRGLIPERILPEDHDGSVDHPLVQREIARVQRIVEGESFDIRKRLWDYSSLIETQRRVLGRWRQEVLEGSAVLDLLESRSPTRWQELRGSVGEELLHEIERRLTLATLDRCWSEHLAELERIRDELHFVALNGRTPLVEFCRIARETFEELLERIDDEIVRRFESLRVTEDGVDWEAEGLVGPSATWTYLVSDDVFGANAFLTLAVRPSIGFMGVLVLGPVLFLWALYEHWRQRRKRRAERGREPPP